MSKVEKDRKENNKLSKNLTKENDRIFTDIVCYLRVSNISEVEQEEIISDILRMFLDWQEEGKSIESMVGEDYKKFTENIISAVNPEKSVPKKIKEYLGILIEVFCILITIDFAFLYFPKLLKGNFNFNLTYEYELTMLIRFIIIFIVSCSFVNYICKNSFELSKKSFSKLPIFIFGFSASGLLILWGVLSEPLKQVVIISVNIRYVIGVIIVYWIYKGVKKAKGLGVVSFGTFTEK